MSDNKKDDYGYFGTGIDGYVHYKQAFDQSFHEDNGVTNEPAKQAPSRHTELQDKETSKKSEQPAPSTPSSHEKEDLFLRWISFIQKITNPLADKGPMYDLLDVMIIMLLLIGPIIFIGGMIIILPLTLVTGSSESAGEILVIALIIYTIYWKLKH